MEDYYEYLDSNGVTTLYKLIKDDTVALIDSYSVTVNGITTTLDIHINDSDIHTPISVIEGMIDTRISGLVNSAPETLDTLKELSDALGNDPNFATTVANQIGNKANSVHTHVVSDITDFPTIPTKVSELSNDSNFVTSSELHDYATKNDLNSKQDTLSEEQLSNIDSIPDKANKSDLSTVATSGSYNDLLDKPVIPEGADLSDYYNKGETDNLLNSKANTSDLAVIAKSGSYNDLINTPTIPTKLSQLENDMGFGTGSGGSGDTSDCVHKTGDEIIDGIKTFTSMLKVSHGTLQVGSDAGYSVTYGWHGVIVSKQPSGTYDIALPKANGTLAIDDNLVHKTGNETIGGFKSFTEVLDRRNDVTISTVATATQLVDTNANRCGWIANRMHWAGNSHVHNRHIAYNENSGKELYIDIISSNDGSGGLFVSGTATNRNLTDVTSATGHTALAAMGWVNNPATATNVVHRSGAETINGTKTFTANIIKKNSGLDLQANPSSNQYNSFLFTDKNNVVMAYLEHVQTTSGVNALGLCVRDKNNATRGIQVTSENNVTPLGDGVVNLGLSGAKWKNVYSNKISFPSDYYITTDSNDNSLRIIRSGSNHGNNYKIIIQGDSGKIFAPNGFQGNLQGNADTATSATSATKAAYLDNYSANNANKIYLDWDKQVTGYVGLKVDNTTMGGLITTNNIGSQAANSATYATTQATTDNSTRIATTAWVRTYVNSVAGSNTIGSSVSAYWSNSSNVTATGSSSSGGYYPACYSDYVNKTPTVGTIYSGAQLYTEYGTSASATGTLQSLGQYSTHITTTTAQVTFRNPISATGKYLCTTANTVKFRAYTTQGSTSTVGASSIVDYTITKSIFIRIE